MITFIDLFSYDPLHEDRINTFSEELRLFSTPVIREFAAYCLDRVPEYFFHVAASPGGRYHPQYALGEGGLVRHTQAAIGIARHIITVGAYPKCPMINGVPTPPIEEQLYLALLLHDSYKCGEYDLPEGSSPRSIFEHPIVAAANIRRMWREFEEIKGGIPMSWHRWMEAMCHAIESHMGKWNTSRVSGIVLPAPGREPPYDNWLCWNVHLCDFLASRKSLEYNFAEHLK